MKRINSISNRIFLLFIAVTLVLGPVRAGFAEPIKEGEKLELLFVQSATSGSFDGKVLTLKNVGPTGFFTDRPQRIAGHQRTSHFIKMWDEGNNSFETDPPNANLAIFGKEDTSNAVMELGQPALAGNTLSYPVKVLKGNIPASFKEASMVIDILGRWAAAMGGAMIGGAIGHSRGLAQGAAYSSYAAPHTVYTSSPPTPCVCKCD
jgi:hypothetical protein